jgi:hypothetical protein
VCCATASRSCARCICRRTRRRGRRMRRVRSPSVISGSRRSRSRRGAAWDGEGAIGRWRAGRAELTGDCQAFRGTLGAKVVVCKPADPEAKGIIERCHDYLERSFLPGHPLRRGRLLARGPGTRRRKEAVTMASSRLPRQRGSRSGARPYPGCRSRLRSCCPHKPHDRSAAASCRKPGLTELSQVKEGMTAGLLRWVWQSPT